MKTSIDPACQAFGMFVASVLKRHRMTHNDFRAHCGVGKSHVNALLKERHS